MATIEEITQQVTDEVEENKPLQKGTSSGLVEFTDEEYAIHIESVANFIYEEQQFGYIQARQEAYGSVQDQLDMQYWDSVNGTTTWADHIAQVKSDNPKPV